MIKLQLEVTPDQMRDIADVMAGVYVKQCPGDCGASAEQIADLDADATTTIIAGEDLEAGDLVTTDGTKADDAPPPPATTECEQPAATVAEPATTNIKPLEQPSFTDANGVTLDSAGLPWDVRIHASTKTTKADGTWKRKVRVTAELVAEVEAELRAAMNATPGDDVPPPPADDPAGALAANNDVPPPPADDRPETFPQLLPLVAAAKANGTITDDQIAVAVAGVGLGKFGELAVRPDLIPAFAEAVGV